MTIKLGDRSFALQPSAIGGRGAADRGEHRQAAGANGPKNRAPSTSPGAFERLLSYRRLNRRSARFFAFTIIENGSMVEPASAGVEVPVPTAIHVPTPIRINTATPAAQNLILRMSFLHSVQLTITPGELSAIFGTNFPSTQ